MNLPNYTKVNHCEAIKIGGEVCFSMLYCKITSLLENYNYMKRPKQIIYLTSLYVCPNSNVAHLSVPQTSAVVQKSESHN